MIDDRYCADLHVHSCRSDKTRPQWFFRQMEIAECYTPPAQVYAMAKARGMDFVTLTDHDTIDGALEIAHLEGAFIGVEISTRFPEEPGVIDVVALGITEVQYRDIKMFQKNIYDLVGYLNRERITHFLAHPLFSGGARLSAGALEKLFLLFKNLEGLNGARVARQRDLLCHIVRGLTPDRIAEWADRHGIEPVGPEPHRKSLVGGSDDHSGLTIARAYTSCGGTVAGNSGVERDGQERLAGWTPRAFLDAIDRGEAEPGGETGTPLSLAANVYGIAYCYFQTDTGARRSGNVFTSFFGSLSAPSKNGRSHARPTLGAKVPCILMPLATRAYGVARRCFPKGAGTGRSDNLYTSFFGGLSAPSKNGRASSHIEAVLREKIHRLLSKRPGLSLPELLRSSQKERSHRACFEGISEVFNEVLGDCCRALAEDLGSLNVERVFQLLGQIASAHFFLAPFYSAFRYQSGDRGYLEKTARHFGAERAVTRPRKVAVFSDCVYEVNGVALSLRRMLGAARASGRPMLLMTSSDRPAGNQDGILNFPAVARFPMPHYPEMSLSIPPLLDLLDRCEREGITTLQVSTPGPVGLAGLLVAYLLGLPTVGFYHTNLPDLIRDVTGDASTDGLVRAYTAWFYRQMDAVFVSSNRSLEDLALMGVERSRLRVVPRGVDLDTFHPMWRDPSIWKGFGIDGELKLLYVGRMSREKNLDVLVEGFKRVVSHTRHVYLVMVGDGPYRAKLERSLTGYPACFTGTLDGEMLSKVYASADLFAFPSSADTFGNVVLEAQASGLPVLVPAQGGARENVLPDVTGVVVDGGPDAFADEIQRLLEDSDRRTRMGAAARTHAERRGLCEAFDRMWEMYP